MNRLNSKKVNTFVVDGQALKFTALRRDDLMELPDPEWIIKPVMPSRGVGAVHGPSTVGKSFLMVDMVAHIAEGREWFGHRVQKRSVAYVCLEGQAGFKRRVQAWEARHERRYPGNVLFIPDQLDVRREEDTAALCALINREFEPGSLVIIDTLNRAAPGMEENGSVDYGLILASAARIEKEIHGFVCFVGHPGKDTSKGFRGHSSLFAGLDMNLELAAACADGLFTWTTKKVKDGAEGVVKHFRRAVIDLGIDKDGDIITSCAIMPEPGADREEKIKIANLSRTNRERFEGFRQAAMEYGRIDDGQFIGLEKENWRSHFYSNSKCENQDARRVAFGRTIKDLEKIGVIYERADGLYSFNGPNAKIQAKIIRAAIEERGSDRRTTSPNTLEHCPDSVRV